MANQFLNLSLFIMLLSFFIILNSVSEIDTRKANPVLNSLSEAFSRKDETLIKPGDVQSSRKATSEGTTLSKIRGLFEAHITGMKVRQNRLGTELRLRLPYETFEQEVIGGLRPENARAVPGGGGFFLDTLISLLDTGQSSQPYKMDMVLYYSADSVTIEEKARTVSARKIAALGSIIEEAGIPQKMLSAGVSNGEAGIIDLYFRAYKPFDAEIFKAALDANAQESEDD